MAETHIAKTVRNTSDNSTRDKEAKEILKCKDVLAHIIKHAVPEYQDFSYDDIATRFIEPESISLHESIEPKAKETIEGISTEDAPAGEGKVNFDVVFKVKLPSEAADEKHSIIYINIEAQGKLNPGYSLLKRAKYYTARLISRQLDSLSDPAAYDTLQKIYSIWICFANETALYTQGCVAKIQPTLTVSGCGKPKFNNRDVDLDEIIIIILDEKDLKSDLIGFLGVLFNWGLTADERLARLQSDHGVKITDELESGVYKMTGMCEYYEERGARNGIEKGIEIGSKRLDDVVADRLKRGDTVEQIVEYMYPHVTKEDVIRIAKERNIPIPNIQ